MAIFFIIAARLGALTLGISADGRLRRISIIAHLSSGAVAVSTKFQSSLTVGRQVACLGLATLWLVLAGAVGCWNEDEPSGGPPPVTQPAAHLQENLTAQTLLERMAAAYRQAKTYQDAGTVTLRFQQQGQNVDEKFDFSVAFVRPNKLRLDCYNVVLRNDGKEVHGFIKNIEELTGQVLSLEAPAELTPTNMLLDATMQDMIRNGVAQAPPQLVLLLADNALEMILSGAEAPLLLPSKNYESDPCHRVRVDSEDGSLMLWIDERTLALRRVDFPTTAFKKNLEQNGPVSGLELYAEFSGAKFNATVPEAAFQFEVPTDAKLVKRLLGPAPSPPSKLLGQPAPEFAFTKVDGTKVTRDDIKDKVVVLDFWFTQCTPCQQSFPLMNKVYQQYKDSDKVLFLAVNADDSSLDNKSVQDTMKSWGSELPLARDPNQDIRKAFDVTGMPTMFVIGPDGKVQHHEMGLNPSIETELPRTIEALLAGNNTFEMAQKQYEQRLAEFEQALQTPPDVPTADGQAMDIPKAQIEPRSEPARYRLTKVWTAADVKLPGNVFVVPASGATDPGKLFVVEGWTSVVEVQWDGTVAARHELPLPADGVVATIRTATDKAGKRYYAVFLTAQQQLYVFDADWKHILTFPQAEDGKHDGVGDVQFADLDADGVLEMGIGYWGDVGVQYVTLDGKRTWTDRSLQYALRLATTTDATGQRRLISANSRGTIGLFGAAGKAAEEVTVPGRPLQTVYAADLNGDGNEEMCGLSFRSLAANSLVGFDLEGKELWNYELPSGVHEKPIESITPARLLGDEGQWLVAGADGSVHILAADGKPLDKFHYGAPLAGLAGAKVNGESVLFIASEQGLEAWKLEPKGASLASPGAKNLE
jgi:peroxiredoxin/outer membrane lipoprotein-sorting protein